MKRIMLLLLACLLFSSHDMFLKMNNYQLEPDTQSTIRLFNGTFEKSDNVITHDRMIEVCLVGNGVREQVDSTLWTEQNDETILNFKSGGEGTWLAGVSTIARNIELDAEAFNSYLEHDGVIDMLEYRKNNNILDTDAIEKYSKHVKTIFQIGDKKTDDYKTILGYPIEFVPLSNPYQAKVDEELQVQLLWRGQPLTNQLVYAGRANQGHSHKEESHSHDDEEDHHHHQADQLRTDEKGIITVKLAASGEWYLRTILMEESDEPGLTHESNWATLTFEIPSDTKVSDNTHTHEDGTVHSHDLGSSQKTAYYLLAFGVLLLAGLLWMLKKKVK